MESCVWVLFSFLCVADLLETGNTRLRKSTDALGAKGSSTQSPRLQRSSPLHRATADTPSAPPQSRTAHTLPPQSTSSTAQAKEESVLERRFTYPSRRSAFTPVIPPTQHQAPPTSTHLTNSHPLIANGGSPSAATETAATETVAVTTTHSAVTASNVVTPSPISVSTSSPLTSHTPSRSSQPASDSATTTSAISIISSSQPHIITTTTSSTTITSSTSSQCHSSTVAKPTPTHPHQHNVTTVPSPTKPPSRITHPPHIHRPTVTSSPPPLHHTSGKTTPIGEVSYTIPPQFVPIGPPMPLFTPVVISYRSPVPSPSPSPLTPSLRGKSSSNIAWTPTEYESLSRWLKGHRLHKYASIFENMTFDEVREIVSSS